MNQHFKTELAAWLPKLSGAAFKCLFVVYLELAASGAAEVVIPRARFVEQSGLAKSTIQDALSELVAVRAAARRPTKGGAFAYSVPGLKIGMPENRDARKSVPTENQSRPKDLFEVFLWHWQNRFPSMTLPEVSAATRAEIVGRLHHFSYKYLMQSFKGLAALEDFNIIKSVLNPETAIKTIKRGNFLYFSWRDARFGGEK